MFAVFVPYGRMRIRANIGHQTGFSVRLQAIGHALNQYHAGCRTLEPSESQPSSIMGKSRGTILESGVRGAERSSYDAGFKGKQSQDSVAHWPALRKDQPFSVRIPGQHPLWDWARPSNQMSGME